MQAHGHGKKTFQYETDAEGEPVVHRVDGQYPYDHYLVNPGYWLEINQKFDIETNNVYFLVIGPSPSADIGIGYGGGWKSRGSLVLSAPFTFETAAHELGHAFGLQHDFRDGRYILSYGPGMNRLSACAAESLAVNPYFNPDIPLEEGTTPTIELMSQRTYPAGTESVTIRVKVSDADGVHQVLLFGFSDLIACRGLSGKKEAIVEFEYEGVNTRKGGYIGLADAVSHSGWCGGC